MIDIIEQVDKAHRELRTRDDAKTVLVRRTYDADVADVWDACTTAERLGRWLSPVSGDLQLGGKYQIEGNASGEVLQCEPPTLLRVSWVYGDDPATNTSEVEVRLADAGEGRTAFELEHVAADIDPKFWAQFGPGAVGIGWDLALLGLASHLAGEDIDVSAAELLQTPEALEFMTRSGRAWGAAHEASGAGADEARGAADNTIAAFTQPPAPAESDA